ncbi:MAG TPA: DUF2842 domain-containing protein [Amaricoccus sp.]|uniref:DUF2842 domain-containing protein n=1 Tax=Amaricoccus sp. TaxID=1872485 RepID=UPI002CD38D3F|nr:DUF2842 domain-containing protein [Amaricoccus sp.]HMQ94856.1 DUF2842 domain-containing protein [Amaricoccus sp.]HMR52162.1 DUF2842 domain-containing protein [Amaricoccus sp.]HMR59801.1 DUF2842 domain-containing protein [Amaricoccus sp.]HMT99014.1 DUF2842 domain-containing protein [Amaricoccus sp.]
MRGLSWRARRRWSLVVLLVGLPLYVTLAVNLVELFDRPGVLVELAIFVGLGFLWMLPLRFVFRGIGREDPEARRRPGGK